MSRPSYRPYLEMDAEGMVRLVDPVGPDDDSIVRRLGEVADPATADLCPPALRGEFDALYRDWVEEMLWTPGGRLELRRLHRVRSR